MLSERQKSSSTLVRSWTISFVVLKHLVFHKFTSLKHASFGERLRRACEKLGPVFIKLGQVLATRYDLLGRSDCEALHGLLDDIAPVPFEEVVALFQSDFRENPDELYREFPRIPIASASIAQVYKAVDHEGRLVAVKVRRPGITRTLKSDIGILKKLVRIAELFSSDLRHIRAREVLSQLESWIFGEADFIQETGNLLALTEFYSQRAAKGDDFAAAIVFPKLWPALCSQNIITMEFLEGIPATKFNKQIAGPAYDEYVSLKAVLGASVRPWVERGAFLFHADPHPANILIMKGGKAGLLDFGLTSSFNKKDSEQLCDLLLAVYTQNLDLTVHHAFALCHAPAVLETPTLRKDIEEYLLKTRTSGFGFWFVGLIRIFVKHRVPMPLQLVLLGRNVVVVEGLFETVIPGKTTLEVMGDELRRGLYRRIFENITSIDAGPLLYALSEKIKKSPGLLAGLINRYFEDPLRAVRDFREAVRI